MLSALVSMYVTSMTILQILEDSQAMNAEAFVGGVETDNRDKDHAFRGSNLEKVHPLPAEPAASPRGARGSTSNLEKVHPLPAEPAASPRGARGSTRRSTSSRGVKTLRYKELRKQRYMEYAVAVILTVNCTIITPLGYLSIHWRNTFEGVTSVSLLIGALGISFASFSVFRYYLMLLKSMDDEASSQVKDHLKTSLV
jgi:hypothetical protein